MVVVVFLELKQSSAELLDRLKGSNPEKVLLQGSNESLSATIALRLSNEGRRGGDSQKSQLVLEVIGHLLRAVIVSNRQAFGNGQWGPWAAFRSLKNG